MKTVDYDESLVTVRSQPMRVLHYNERLLQSAAGEVIVLLVRHGASQEDLDNAFCGWCNSPMVPLGHQQMTDVATWLNNSDIRFGDVYTDDLERTDESADYLLPVSVTGQQVILPQLRAWGLGPEFAGKEKTPELEKKRKYYVSHPDELPPGPDSETLNHNRSGWMSAFTYIVSQTQPGLASVIVCHSNGPKILSVIYQNQKLKLGHGGIMAVRVRQDGVVIDTLLEGWVEDPELDGGESLGTEPVK